jgi:CheY-like chemotaxis protein
VANLISNAIKFTAQGDVIVKVQRITRDALSPERLAQVAQGYDGYLHVSVADTGIGIASDHLEKIFQSFTQVDPSTTRKYGGTGLGLTISRQLVEMMGGCIWAESELGKGSVFHVILPLEPAQLPERSSMEVHPALVPAEQLLKGKCAMIVDDNPTNLKVLSGQLERWKMQVNSFNDPNSALAYVKQGNAIDVIIVDMQMPGMDGLTLVEEIKKERGNQCPPIVMLSSIIDAERPKDTSLFAAWLNKPLKPEQLLKTMQQLFSPAQEEVSRAIPEEPKEVKPLKHPVRILLAEDNLINQRVALRMLERLGYSADIAMNGEEVIDALRRQPYDVILMDVQMPEMDGEDATVAIRTTFPPESQPYIIAMTANAMEGDRERYLSLGMNDYLSKPVRPDELEKALQIALQRNFR